MPETDDLYEILQVHPSAHLDVIEAAYRKLSLRHHPDRDRSPGSTDRMKKINHAYEVLSDPQKREEYNRKRRVEAIPESASEAVLLKGADYFERKEYGRATEHCNVAISLDTNSFMAYYLRGTTYEELGEYRRAVQDYDRALNLNPNDADIRHARKIAHEKLEQSRREERLLSEILRDLERGNPQNAYASSGVSQQHSESKIESIAQVAFAALQIPEVVIGIGALLTVVSLLLAAQHALVFTIMLLGGALGLGAGLYELGRRKGKRNRLRPKHIWALIAVSGLFLVTGLANMLASSTGPTIVTLGGVAIMGVGLIVKRGHGKG